jgi:nitrous oxidase accessory protein
MTPGARTEPFRPSGRLSVLLLFAVFAVPAWGAEIRVRPGESIAAAVAMAKSGDTVKVAHGHYHEHIRIDKPLTLQGIGRPTLSGDEEGDVIRIAAKNVTVDGFIIRDSGGDLTAQNAGVYLQPGSDNAVVSHCDLVYNLFGLWIEASSDVRVEGNLITGKRDFASVNRGNGIQVYNAQRARIIGNHVSFTRDGIYVDVTHHAEFKNNVIHDVRYGTHYMNSYHNLWENNEVYHNRGGLALMEVRSVVVRNNRVWGNSDHGIMLRTIQDSVIENNVVSGNERGFFIYDAEYNILRNNLVVGNRVGIHLWAGSIHNLVEGNDIIQNRDQIRYVASHDENWGTEIGNYWSNYLGWDRDGNGIGDFPYEANDVVDRLTWRHPLMKLLLNSPAIQTLRLVAMQFPLLRAPSVVDRKPHMQPFHPDWSKWIGRPGH